MHRRWVEQKTGMLRHGFAEEYRSVIGVAPEQHSCLIELLRQNESTGEQRWNQMIEQLRNERGFAPEKSNHHQELDAKLSLPNEFRNMSRSRMQREFAIDQEHLLEQDRQQEYERIVGISMAYHYLLIDLLEEAMRTGEQSLSDIESLIHNQYIGE